MRKPRTNIKKTKRIESILDADWSRPLDLAIPTTHKDGKTTVSVFRNVKLLSVHLSGSTTPMATSFTVKPFND